MGTVLIFFVHGSIMYFEIEYFLITTIAFSAKALSCFHINFRNNCFKFCEECHWDVGMEVNMLIAFKNKAFSQS